jgi:hypothetical protein
MPARFPLTDDEKGYLAITYIVDARWGAIGLTKDEGLSFLIHFFKSLLRKDAPEKIAKTLYLSLQNTLMACRKDEFLLIQSESPFSPFSMQNLISLLKFWQVNGEPGVKGEFARIFSRPNIERPKYPLAEFTGGPGYSEETAIVIHANDNKTGVNAEYWYLNYMYGRGWQLMEQHLIGDDESTEKYDVVTVQFVDQRIVHFYFYITHIFGVQNPNN